MSRMGFRIKSLRTTKGMTQKQLARTIGVSEGFIDEVESGRRVMNDELIKKVSKILEQEISDTMLAEAVEGPKGDSPVKDRSVKETGKGEEKKVPVVQEVWSDALGSVLKAVPVYAYDLQKPIEIRQLPVVSNKIDGYPKEKVLFIQIQDNDMIGFRIIRGDVAFAHQTHEVENNSICLIEYNNQRVIRQIKKLDNEKFLLLSNKGTLATDTASTKNIKVLARLVRLEIKL